MAFKPFTKKDSPKTKAPAPKGGKAKPMPMTKKKGC